MSTLDALLLDDSVPPPPPPVATRGLTAAQWKTPARVLLAAIAWDRGTIDPKRTTARRFLEHL